MEKGLESRVRYEANLNAVESAAVRSILVMGNVIDRAYKFPQATTTEAPMKELAYGTRRSGLRRLARQPEYAFAQ